MRSSDVDRDVEGPRLGQAARATAATVDGVDGDVAGRRDGGCEPVQLRCVGERAVEEDDHAGSVTGDPPADGVAAWPGQLARATLRPAGRGPHPAGACRPVCAAGRPAG